MSYKSIIKRYTYSLPPELIAQTPALPRDSAGLLIYNRKTEQISFSDFAHLADFLPKNSVLVFNETKVVPARLPAIKQTGGKVRFLYLGATPYFIQALADRPLKVGESLLIKNKSRLTVVKKEENVYTLRPSFSIKKLSKILLIYGETPIPPYIKKGSLSESVLRKEYQTVFARAEGSVAAPTAALHFTKRLIQNLKRRGVKVEFVTLHVNLGTFAPLTPKQIDQHKLHEEFYTIDYKTAQRLNAYKAEGRLIVAVGTTVVRTLESATQQSKLKKITGTTDLFITEDYKLKFVDALITNFHVPRSSLLMLVACLVGREKLLQLYKKAIKRRFRFFSFGDGMFIK